MTAYPEPPRQLPPACEQIRSLGLSQSAPQGIRVTLAVTHEEIGQIINSSRETVTGTLGELKHNDLVASHGSTLLIRNRMALESFVGSYYKSPTLPRPWHRSFGVGAPTFFIASLPSTVRFSCSWGCATLLCDRRHSGW
jgi:Crp-like helix-turn-helix protein